MARQRETGSHWYIATHLLILIISMATVALTPAAEATPLEGFLEGPYLQFMVGARNAAFDRNLATGSNIGREIEPLYGFTFGWNLTDPWAFELLGYYSSSGTSSTQQHLMSLRAGMRWNWITRALTNFRSFRILPFVAASPIAQLNISPGATATSGRATQWGGGIGGGGGVSLLFFHDHVFLTLREHTDLVYRRGVSENVGGVETAVYGSGWGVDWSSMAELGVHF